jgi:3-hydroxybutyryl-CoA dehydrogenase
MSEKIAVVGAGPDGSGIAHVAALSGFPVTMIDVAESALEKGAPPLPGTWNGR